MFKRFYRNRYGYSRWDGTQRIEGLDADDILDALSDEYIEDGNLQQALRRLMQDGMRSDDGKRTMGLRELMERMRNQRNQQLNRYNMASGVMDDLREKLEEIKGLERAGIQRRLDDRQDSSSQQRQPGQETGRSTLRWTAVARATRRTRRWPARAGKIRPAGTSWAARAKRSAWTNGPGGAVW